MNSSKFQLISTAIRAQPQVTPNVRSGKNMNTKGRTLALTGAWLQLGPLFGLLGTVIGMISAFQKMGSDSMGQPEALANDIGFSLVTTAIGLVFGVIGLILMLIALFGQKYRAPWFFWFLTIYSILWIFNFPVGTVLGIGLLIFLITRKEEFKNKTEPGSGAYSKNAGQVGEA